MRPLLCEENKRERVVSPPHRHKNQQLVYSLQQSAVQTHHYSSPVSADHFLSFPCTVQLLARDRCSFSLTPVLCLHLPETLVLLWSSAVSKKNFSVLRSHGFVAPPACQESARGSLCSGGKDEEIGAWLPGRTLGSLLA